MAGLMDENKNVIVMIEKYLHRLIYYFHSVSQAFDKINKLNPKKCKVIIINITISN